MPAFLSVGGDQVGYSGSNSRHYRAQTLAADNVPVGTEAGIFWRVEDPRTAALAVANYAEAVFQAANSALKDPVGTLEL